MQQKISVKPVNKGHHKWSLSGGEANHRRDRACSLYTSDVNLEVYGVLLRQ